jgi:hypothetical protein
MQQPFQLGFEDRFPKDQKQGLDVSARPVDL